MPLVSNDEMTEFATGLDHPEGLCVGVDGTVWAGGEAGQIYRIEAGKAVEAANCSGFTAGLATDADGRVYACDFANASIWRTTRRGLLELFCDQFGDRKLKAPNWGAFAPDGSYYVSDSGGFGTSDGCIGVVPPDGISRVWTDVPCRFPNGLAVSPEGDALYVVESNPKPRLSRFPIHADGSCGNGSVVVEFPETEWPDGVACAENGALLISCYRPDRIYLWRPDDGLIILAEDPLGVILAAPTNIAFFGDTLEELLTTNLGRWHLTRLPARVRGTRLHYPNFPGRS